MAPQINEPEINEPGITEPAYSHDTANQQARDDTWFIPPLLKPVSGPPPPPNPPPPPPPVTLIPSPTGLEDSSDEPYTLTRPIYGPITGSPPWWSSDSSEPPPWLVSGPTKLTTVIASTKASYLWENAGWSSSQATSSARHVGSNQNPPSTPDADGFVHGPPGPKSDHDNVGLYAAAAIIPVVVLAVLAGIVLFCLRKRKRRQKNMAESQRTQEMKMSSHPQPTVRAYIASPPAVLPSPFTSRTQLPTLTPVPSQPIILGPIPSGTNGAYFTGIDTSDMVSVTSANNLQPGVSDPFSDHSSLAEAPPPPYSPGAGAPPSFSSRQSSLRASGPPPATSQTHLIDGSPFSDPDDDAISEISGPTAERSRDAMSVVSDLSYQQEPAVTRTPL